jgi:hypothetical protein
MKNSKKVIRVHKSIKSFVNNINNDISLDMFQMRFILIDQ